MWRWSLGAWWRRGAIRADLADLREASAAPSAGGCRRLRGGGAGRARGRFLSGERGAARARRDEREAAR